MAVEFTAKLDYFFSALFMDNGMIAADGSPEELIDNPENPRLRQFLNFVSK